METPVRAVLDANVLYANFSRDLFLSLFAAKLYEARWTDLINNEWVRNLIQKEPDLSQEKLQRTVKLMNTIDNNALVKDYEHLIETLELPDQDDRHVVAAAIVSESSTIVTWNLKDFPARALKEWGLVAESPDVFIEKLLNIDPDSVVSVLREMRLRLRKPPMDVDGFFEALARNHFTRTKTFLERYRSKL